MNLRGNGVELQLRVRRDLLEQLLLLLDASHRADPFAARPRQRQAEVGVEEVEVLVVLGGYSTKVVVLAFLTWHGIGDQATLDAELSHERQVRKASIQGRPPAAAQ